MQVYLKYSSIYVNLLCRCEDSHSDERIRHRIEEQADMETKKKDSVLFKPLVRVAEKYLRDYCNGKQADDEKAKVALRVLSVYRRILRVEKERAEIKAEWERLISEVTELKRLTRRRVKKGRRRNAKAGKAKPS